MKFDRNLSNNAANVSVEFQSNNAANVSVEFQSNGMI